VSASAVILERRVQPLAEPADAGAEAIHFNLLEKVGWDLQSTPSVRLYQRDRRDGSLLRDCCGRPIPDADFDRALRELRSSPVAGAFPWLLEGLDPRTGAQPAPCEACVSGVPLSLISGRDDLCLDPKRWCPKHACVVAAVRDVRHMTICDVVRPVARPFRPRPEVCYRYVEIEKICESFGTYSPEDCVGWELPRRAKLCAAPGDLFIANIWSSAGKWMIAGADARDGRLLVTNGCTQFELIPGREALLPELVFGLCSEAFRVQMRARACGSDGLSWITTEDILSIVVPVQDPASDARAVIERRIQDSCSGQLHLPSLVSNELARIAPAVNIPRRASHTAQV
jgi:hypothetical protein